MEEKRHRPWHVVCRSSPAATLARQARACHVWKELDEFSIIKSQWHACSKHLARDLPYRWFDVQVPTHGGKGRWHRGYLFWSLALMCQATEGSEWKQFGAICLEPQLWPDGVRVSVCRPALSKNPPRNRASSGKGSSQPL